jgi:acylphosphatase
MNQKAVLVRIAGRVQGVGFRAWTRDQAQSLGLAGWVRNEADGSVSALIAGPAERVDEMIARLQNGPAGARVDEVRSREAKPEDAPARFEVRR